MSDAPTVPGYRILKVISKGEGKFTELLCEEIGGGIREASEALLFPGGRAVRVKSSRSAGESLIIAVKGAVRSSLFTGAVLLSRDWPIAAHREALLIPDGRPLPDETEAVRGGPCPDFNRERFIGRGRFRMEGSYIHLSLPDPFPLFSGASLSILGPDGSPRRFTVLWPGRPEPDQLRRLNQMARRRPDPHPPVPEILGRILHAAGFVEVPPAMEHLVWPDSSSAGSWRVLESRRPVLERRIIKSVSRPGGVEATQIRIESCPDSLVSALVDDITARGGLCRRGAWVFPAGPPPLAPYHRGWLARVEAAGTEGLRLSSVTRDSDREALEVLGRSGLIRGGADIWLSPGAYDELASVLLSGRNPGDPVSMAEARGLLGGSRVRTLELLGILESDGRLGRSGTGEDRIVT